MISASRTKSIFIIIINYYYLIIFVELAGPELAWKQSCLQDYRQALPRSLFLFLREAKEKMLSFVSPLNAHSVERGDEINRKSPDSRRPIPGPQVSAEPAALQLRRAAGSPEGPTAPARGPSSVSAPVSWPPPCLAGVGPCCGLALLGCGREASGSYSGREWKGAPLGVISVCLITG